MRRILYLGTDPLHYEKNEGVNVFHYPIIKIVPRTLNDPDLLNCLEKLASYTHIIFTSKNAVAIFFDRIKQHNIDYSHLESKEFIAVGQVTALHLTSFGIKAKIAQDERQEGIIDLLSLIDLKDANVLMPRSSLARPHIVNYLLDVGVRHLTLDLYDCLPHRIEPLPNLNDFDEIVFTSPSTVDAFIKIYKTLPKDKVLTPIGPVTRSALNEKI